MEGIEEENNKFGLYLYLRGVKGRDFKKVYLRGR